MAMNTEQFPRRLKRRLEATDTENNMEKAREQQGSLKEKGSKKEIVSERYI